MAVDLPKVQNATWQPGALREDFMWIVVTRDGVVYFRRNRIHDEIPDVMRAALHDGSEKKVYPSVDTYGPVSYTHLSHAAPTTSSPTFPALAFPTT